MKVRLVDINESSGHFNNREDMMGLVGDLVEVEDHPEMGDGWRYVRIENCKYKKHSEYCPVDGDVSIVFGAKIEYVLEETNVA